MPTTSNNISGSFHKVYHDNYVKLLNQTKTNLQRLTDLPLSLIESESDKSDVTCGQVW